MYEVIDREEDMAGKWRIRMLVGNQVAMFKFDEQPDDETVQAEALRFAARMQQMEEQAALEAEKAARLEALMQEQADGATIAE